VQRFARGGSEARGSRGQPGAAGGVVASSGMSLGLPAVGKVLRPAGWDRSWSPPYFAVALKTEASNTGSEGSVA
jgi:hypothetical protein